MKLHVIQNTNGGIPEDPEIFLDESAALARFTKYWRTLKFDGNGDRVLKSRLGNVSYLHNGDYDEEVRWYAIEVGLPLEKAAATFVSTIEATGGVRRNPKGEYEPVGDREWIDLGDAYVGVCRALGREPTVEACDELGEPIPTKPKRKEAKRS